MEDQMPKMTLRPFELSDIDDFMVWATDDLVTRFCLFETCTYLEAGFGFLKEGHLSYMLASTYWGRGLAMTAVKAAVSRVFKDIPELERLDAFVDAENVGSQRVLEKVGWVHEEVLESEGEDLGLCAL
ncbi:hypothetical protein AMTRI_Chr03g55390 [Amborella trichopoda]